jgi:hypothetical protein
MIKKILLLVIIAFSFNACNEETLPVPNAFQVSLDNEFWSTLSYDAVVATNLTTITVTKGNEQIKFTINDDNVGVYSLNGTSHAVTYIEDTVAGTEPYISTSGELEITEFDFLNKTITGHFHFRATRTSDGDVKSFTRGEIYKVSFTVDNSFFNNIFGAYLDGAQMPLGAIAPQNLAGQIILTVTFNDGSKVILKMPNNIAPGTYNITNVGATTAQYIDAAGTVFDACGSGSSLVISAHDTTAQTVTGTFLYDACPSGSGTSSHQITLGTFSIAY